MPCCAQHSFAGISRRYPCNHAYEQVSRKYSIVEAERGESLVRSRHLAGQASAACAFGGHARDDVMSTLR